MFESLTNKLSNILKNISGNKKISQNNIQKALEDVKQSLLEADVDLSVLNNFITKIRNKCIGQQVDPKLTPGQFFIKIVKNELINLMGKEKSALNFQAQSPVIILVTGLQGSGKTTSCAKLAKYLKQNFNKSVMLVSTDIYRSAAIQQLKIVAYEANASFFPSTSDQHPKFIVKSAINFAKQTHKDVLIIDTAGRMHIDKHMMKEILDISNIANPTEILFVADSMTGQDASNTAKTFNDLLPLTGVILTKIDGDTRGGAAISISYITGKPIKFLGVGEKLDAIEVFYPDRIASRILGMGDILTLIEDIENKFDKNKHDNIAKKLLKGKGFNLEDMRVQLKQMTNVGGISGILDKLPNIASLSINANNNPDENLKKMMVVIDSMTNKERVFPLFIKGSHKRRIAYGSGTKVSDVNKVLKQHIKMQKMFKKIKNKNSMLKMMRGKFN